MHAITNFALYWLTRLVFLSFLPYNFAGQNNPDIVSIHLSWSCFHGNSSSHCLSNHASLLLAMIIKNASNLRQSVFILVIKLILIDISSLMLCMLPCMCVWLWVCKCLYVIYGLSCSMFCSSYLLQRASSSVTRIYV